MIGTLLLAGALSAAAGAPQTAAGPHFHISGIALNAHDGAPIPRCHMAAAPANPTRGGPPDVIQQDADASGHFDLELPAPGDWSLTAGAHNFRTQSLDEHEGFFTGVILSNANPTVDLVFHVVPDSIIAGTVTDEAGEPVRDANVTLYVLDPTAPPSGLPAMQQRGGTQTDDLGRFEFAALPPGRYMVDVQARPWFATPASLPALDPSLDVVYASTWYPGVTDPAAAGTLTLHPADRVEADFRLQAIPGAHLRFPAPAAPPPEEVRESGTGRRGMSDPPIVSLLLPNGTAQQVFGNFNFDGSGQVEIDGLAPGTYQVTAPRAAPGALGRTSIVHIGAGGSTTDLQTGPNEVAVTLSIAGVDNVDPANLILVDTASGRPSNALQPSGRRGARGRGGPNGPGTSGIQQRPPGSTPPRPGARRNRPNRPALRSRPADGDAPETTLHLAPGRYEVTLPGDADAFLTGLSAKGAEVQGRFLTIAGTDAEVVAHLQSGFASVDGFAFLDRKPCSGALLLLVPTTLGSPAGLTVVQRDQTNSDGSFHLARVIPGQYILLSIDRGWGIDWTDPATLRPYLLRGTPLDLHPSEAARPQLQAIPR